MTDPRVIHHTPVIKGGDIRRNWLLYDADGAVLGRLASVVAHRLRGKHKPGFSPHLDTGDFVVIVNAEKIRVSGRKETDKVYYRHSGYPGGLSERTVKAVRASHPERLLQSAVRGMLPKGPLGRAMFDKLKVYAGGEHPHTAQQPVRQTIGGKTAQQTAEKPAETAAAEKAQG
ncbi:MAG: 50S ribosomal protein L13 [Gammaproteobacteria bacterium]